MTCTLYPYLTGCPRDGNALVGRRRRWCSDACSRAYFTDHDWNAARKRAKRRDGYKCTKCGSRDRLEVNHIEPRNGAGYAWSCGHHQDNLETVCKTCHNLITKQQIADRKQAKAPAD